MNVYFKPKSLSILIESVSVQWHLISVHDAPLYFNKFNIKAEISSLLPILFQQQVEVWSISPIPNFRYDTCNFIFGSRSQENINLRLFLQLGMNRWCAPSLLILGNSIFIKLL